MSFISYAQNNEDVLLWRALGDVPPAAGFYIDVGASDPVEHSVTKAFYDAGWRGINIEPLPVHGAAFEQQRPRDVNLAVAAGSRAGSLTLYDVPAVRGWASPDPVVAARHRAAGHAVAELTVPVRTLAAICAEHVRGPVHFLKIDVEGFERDVLRGMDFARWRPWVLVIEATLPNSRVTNHDSWEALVTLHGYRFAWFDGLNRYYVADEHAALLRHFGVQPNVFDDYISYHLERAWDATRRTEQALQAGDARLQAAQRGAIDAQAGTLRAQADAIQARTALAEARADTVRAQAGIIQAQAGAVQAQADALQARAEAAQARAAATQASADAAAARTGAAKDAAALAQALADAAAARCETTQAQEHAAAERDKAARAHAALARVNAGIAVTQAAAQAEIARMHGEYEQAVANGRQVAAWAHDLEQRLLATLDSPSWKLTQPLRALRAWLQRLRRPGLAWPGLAWPGHAWPGHAWPGLARRALQCVTANQRMRRALIPALLRYPALGQRVSGVLRRLRQDAPAAAPAALVVPEDLRHLPASVRTVLADLRRVRGRQQQQQPHEQQQPTPLQQAPLQPAQAHQAGKPCAS
jgi:FkbM family methyltransferase